RGGRRRARSGGPARCAPTSAGAPARRRGCAPPLPACRPSRAAVYVVARAPPPSECASPRRADGRVPLRRAVDERRYDGATSEEDPMADRSADGPIVVISFKDLDGDDAVRERIDTRCRALSAEFPEANRFEMTLAPDGAGHTAHV